MSLVGILGQVCLALFHADREETLEEKLLVTALDLLSCQMFTAHATPPGFHFHTHRMKWDFLSWVVPSKLYNPHDIRTNPEYYALS